MRKAGLVLIAFLGIAVGFYPILYFLVDMSGGLISTKPDFVREAPLWNIAFYQHITFGGLALLTGWSQFVGRIRRRYLFFHRILGKGYVVVCLFSGTAGLYLAFFATGGIIASLGFGGLALSWLFSTSKAYLAIRAGRIDEHRAWMTRSYALTFAAVTLRLWMPIFSMGLGMAYWTAYLIVAWLCWVPNLLIAEILIRKARVREPFPH